MSEVHVDQFAKADGSQKTNADYVLGGCAKAWMNMDQTVQTASADQTGVRDSLNVSSTIDSGAGNTTMSFAVAFNGDGYTPSGYASQLNNNPRMRLTTSMTVTTYRYQNENTAGNGADCPYDFVTIHGELA